VAVLRVAYVWLVFTSQFGARRARHRPWRASGLDRRARRRTAGAAIPRLPAKGVNLRLQLLFVPFHGPLRRVSSPRCRHGPRRCACSLRSQDRSGPAETRGAARPGHINRRAMAEANQRLLAPPERWPWWRRLRTTLLPSRERQPATGSVPIRADQYAGRGYPSRFRSFVMEKSGSRCQLC
jgi:hypothetical protein